MSDGQILLGDCLDSLRKLPDGCVQMCVTSPPYWGLRSYLPDGHPDKALERGCEPTPQEYVAKMVEVFREVKRVLRDDGTLWLNLGLSYATGGRGTTAAVAEQWGRKWIICELNPAYCELARQCIGKATLPLLEPQ
jgi:DNA modification methylase